MKYKATQGNTFIYKVADVTCYTGYFFVNGSTVDFKVAGVGTVTGNIQKVSNTIIFSNYNAWDDIINGTYKDIIKGSDSVEDYSNLEPNMDQNMHR